MRALLFALLVSATPTMAWEFTPNPICILRHSTPEATILVTFDPAQSIYSLRITRAADDWAQTSRFGIEFEGGYPLAIGTTRQQLSGRTLTVQDTGFGNVLNGLEYNARATAFTDTQVVDFDLTGAADPVRAFRDCPVSAPATS